jgi:hypothetical protein
MKAIEKLFGSAENALVSNNLVVNNTISQTSVGAIAGFGALVINIGLLPSLAVYKANNKEVFEALCNVTSLNFESVKNSVNDLSKKRLYTEKFINASVALKIMARTFKIKKSDGEE